MRISDWSSDVCSSDLERFARQYPFEPPPEFPLASPLRALSSPSFGSHRVCSDSILSLERSADAAALRLGIIHFHSARGFSTQILAHTIVSLVRVSRRVEIGRAHV